LHIRIRHETLQYLKQKFDVDLDVLIILEKNSLEQESMFPYRFLLQLFLLLYFYSVHEVELSLYLMIKYPLFIKQPLNITRKI
jgi:hypothetical protein